jgi:hypothetical protein
MARTPPKVKQVGRDGGRKVYNPERPNSRAHWGTFCPTILRYGNTFSSDKAFALKLSEGNVRMIDRGSGETWILTTEQARIFSSQLQYAAKWADKQKADGLPPTTPSVLKELDQNDDTLHSDIRDDHPEEG